MILDICRKEKVIFYFVYQERNGNYKYVSSIRNSNHKVVEEHSN